MHITDVASCEPLATATLRSPPRTVASGPRGPRHHSTTNAVWLNGGRTLAVLRAMYVDETGGDMLIYWLNLFNFGALLDERGGASPRGLRVQQQSVGLGRADAAGGVQGWGCGCSVQLQCTTAVEVSAFCGQPLRMVAGGFMAGAAEPASVWMWKWRFWLEECMHCQPLSVGGGGSSGGGGGVGGGRGGSQSAPPGQTDDEVVSHHYRTSIRDSRGPPPDAFCSYCSRPASECNQYSNWFCRGARLLQMHARQVCECVISACRYKGSCLWMGKHCVECCNWLRLTVLFFFFWFGI